MNQGKKIDFSTDFDALLLTAKAEWDEYRGVIEKWKHTYYGGGRVAWPVEVEPIIKEAHKRWLTWIKENITDRGLEIERNYEGIPVAITAVLSGHHVWPQWQSTDEMMK